MNPPFAPMPKAFRLTLVSTVKAHVEGRRVGAARLSPDGVEAPFRSDAQGRFGFPDVDGPDCQTLTVSAPGYLLRSEPPKAQLA